MPAMQERPPTKIGSLEMDGPAPQPVLPPGGSLAPVNPRANATSAAPVMAHWSEPGLAAAQPAVGAAAPGHAGANPLAGKNFYLDPVSKAKTQAADWRTTRPDDAAQLDKIANTPQATWLGESKTIETDVHNKVEAAKAQGTVPVFVAYNIPNREVGPEAKWV